MKRTETIIWIPVAEALPDDEETKLLDHPDFDEPVWLGFHNDGLWFTAEGNPLPAGVVKAWAELPMGASS